MIYKFKNIILILLITLIVVCMPSFALRNLKSVNKVNKVNAESTNLVDMRQYVIDTENMIRTNWQPPASSKIYYSTISITIDKNGNLVKYSMPIASQNNEFNDSIIKAVNNTQYMPLPDAYQSKTINLRYTFGSGSTKKDMKPDVGNMYF